MTQTMTAAAQSVPISNLPDIGYMKDNPMSNVENEIQDSCAINDIFNEINREEKNLKQNINFDSLMEKRQREDQELKTMMQGGAAPTGARGSLPQQPPNMPNNIMASANNPMQPPEMKQQMQPPHITEPADDLTAMASPLLMPQDIEPFEDLDKYTNDIDNDNDYSISPSKNSMRGVYKIYRDNVNAICLMCLIYYVFHYLKLPIYFIATIYEVTDYNLLVYKLPLYAFLFSMMTVFIMSYTEITIKV